MRATWIPIVLLTTAFCSVADLSELPEKAGLSESSIKKVEAGSPRITVGAYLSLLDVLGMPTALDQVLAPGSDTLGEALARSATRQRAGSPRRLVGDDDEWEI